MKKKANNILWDDVYFSQKYAIYAVFRILNEQQLLTKVAVVDNIKNFFSEFCYIVSNAKVFLAIYGMFYSPSMEHYVKSPIFVQKVHFDKKKYTLNFWYL